MQNDTPAMSGGMVRGLEAAVPALALVAIVIALVAPRATPGLLGMLALPIVVLAAWKGELIRPRRLQPLEWAVLALGIYLIINASWAVDKGEAYSKVALFFVFAGATSLANTALGSADRETAQAFRRAILVSVMIGLAYLVIACVFGQPIKRLVASMVPALRPAAKHIVVEDGWVTQIGLYVLNRNLAILTLLLWPALLMLRDAGPRRMTKWLSLGMVLLSAVAIFYSEHETSMIAIVVTSAVFVGMLLAPKVVRGVVLAGWVAALLLIVPAATAAYQAGLYKEERIPLTGRNRIVLWGVTASKVMDAPVLGVGVNSTKPLDKEAASEAAWPKDHPYPLRTGRHSHNIYMQTWYELGGVGALLMLVIGVVTLRALRRLDEDLQPYLYASFVSAAVIGAFSWGMWQPWFMAAFGLWAVLMLAAIELGRRAGGERNAAG